MKSYRTAIASLVLAFVFSTPAFADDGIIHTGLTPSPPPPQVEGIIHTGIADPMPEEEDVLTEIMLNLLQTLILLP